MLARLLSLNAVRLLAALLLATIGLQAGAPTGAVLQATHGSAFSATTHEVALAPQRQDQAKRVAVAPMPAALRAIVPVGPQSVAILAHQPAVRPDSTGPPTTTILARQPAPRGPPPA